MTSTNISCAYEIESDLPLAGAELRCRILKNLRYHQGCPSSSCSIFTNKINGVWWVGEIEEWGVTLVGEKLDWYSGCLSWGGAWAPWGLNLGIDEAGNCFCSTRPTHITLRKRIEIKEWKWDIFMHNDIKINCVMVVGGVPPLVVSLAGDCAAALELLPVLFCCDFF